MHGPPTTETHATDVALGRGLRGRARLAAAAGLIVALALALYASTVPLNGDPIAGTERPDSSELTGGASGTRAPEFVNADGSAALVGLDTQPIRIGDFAGRPLWIVFWATWCVPCQEEAADIQAAYHAHTSDNLAVLAIDVQEPAAAVNQFMAVHGLDYTVGLDPTGATMVLYGSHGLPSHVFVDRDGTIRERYAGQLTAPLMELKIQAIVGR